MIDTKDTMKSVIAALLGAMLSMQPAAAGVFDDITFSMQDRSGGRGGQGPRDARQPVRAAQPAPPPPAPRERPRGQMSDEERRQLHRDLDKANREIYRGKR